MLVKQKEKTMNKLKENNKVVFSDGAFCVIENYSVDISGLNGTIVYISNDKSEIHVEMEKEIKGLSDWDNIIHFGIGTPIEVLHELIK